MPSGTFWPLPTPSDAFGRPPTPSDAFGRLRTPVQVYTSLSGWTGERTSEAVGTAQLMLLGRWLRRRGYAFWSLGHCYSPEMDYKRQLGHRIYTREQASSRPAPAISRHLPPSPAFSRHLPPSPAISHMLPPSLDFSAFSDLLPPSNAFSSAAFCIATREQFRALLKRHRGPFELSGASAAAAAAHGLRPADQIDEADLLELSGAQGDGPQPRLS